MDAQRLDRLLVDRARSTPSQKAGKLVFPVILQQPREQQHMNERAEMNDAERIAPWDARDEDEPFCRFLGDARTRLLALLELCAYHILQ